MNKTIAIITGATGGIGKEFVTQLVNDHKVKEVWAVARNAEKLGALAEEFGSRVRTIKLDLTDEKAVGNFGSLLENEKPVIRFLINNAGAGQMGRSDELSAEDISKTIDLNCKAIALLCNICIPFMKKGSRILNVSSASSFQPTPYLNLYSASKVFVRYYSRALNQELKKTGISVTAVCPGWVDTDMLPKEKNGKKINYPGLTTARHVVTMALMDAMRKKELSVCPVYSKFLHVYGKIMPQKLIMRQWKYWIKDYI